MLFFSPGLTCNYATELGQQRYNITLLFSIDMSVQWSVLMDACNAAYYNSVSAAEVSLCFILSHHGHHEVTNPVLSLYLCSMCEPGKHSHKRLLWSPHFPHTCFVTWVRTCFGM